MDKKIFQKIEIKEKIGKFEFHRNFSFSNVIHRLSRDFKIPKIIIKYTYTKITTEKNKGRKATLPGISFIQ